MSYGFTEYSIRQADALAEDDQVLLMLVTDQAISEARDLRPTVDLCVFDRPRLRQPLRNGRVIGAVLHKTRKFNPDVFHYQHGHLWFNLALPILSGIPLVVTIHDPRHHEGDIESQKTPQFLMDFGYRRADQVIVHGQSLVPVVRDEVGVPMERINVVPHVAIGAMIGAGARREDENTILFFGRIWEYKGLEHLIRAEPLIAEQVPDVRIVIAGEGEDFAPYRSLMTNPSRFEVHNSWIDDEFRAELFQRAAVVVLPYTSATQSGVIPVAYTHARPVVATNVGTLPEYVDHGHTGFLVPPADERALADAVVSLLRDTQMRRRMGENGRRKLESEWAPDVIARRTTEVYRRAINERRRKRRWR